ncbi:M20/M25/M40 family metallo-hydrolase [Sphingomonas parva]|uniref:M20/M25/M40 family metallo-hydrolase n=1 Tax=Sphingomonas parva TaxID=2555898 RepID=A0A4Y8ZX46_9SPHN|nr:M20/M25/M40 family metallo-hydrolase [Sphingomonas parva]TFI59359.1 M20/M25/M40 family metallo-hydrolase [Sphingomonas parva]
MRRTWAAAAALLFLLVALGFKGAMVQVPDVPAQAAPGAFDTGRALARLARILGDERPHPVDSPANDAVRARLVAELRALGLAPVVTDGIACSGFPRMRFVTCARVRNVRATFGPATGRHLLIASHYDSSPTGPGAADDGLGVAVALETAALLKARRLARPVTLLFTDGEEAGLLGARFFLDQDPLAARVGAAINLEARGVTGPAIMFETSRPNGPAIAAFAAGAVRPVASSLTADAYSNIPNATDVTFFHERPWTMLNYAIIGNESRYHSRDDRLANLDPRSVRHMGIQALAAAARLATSPALPVGGGGETVYADLLGRALLRLPQPLAVGGVIVLFAGAALVAWRRRRGLAGALALLAGALLAAVVATLLGQAAVWMVKPGAFWLAHPELTSAAIDASALAAALALFAWRRPADRRALRAAFWLLFLAFGTLIALTMPGASIFFLAPPAVALLGMALAPRWPRAERVGALAAWILLLLSWAPLLHLAQVLLGLSAAWLFAPIAALLVLPVLIELTPRLGDVPASAGLTAAAALLAGGWAVAAAAPAYDAAAKQNFRIDYAWDPAARRGQWLVNHDGGPLPAAFAGFRRNAEVPWAPGKRLGAPAPPVPLAAPSAEMLERRSIRGGRLVTLRLRGAGAESLLLRFAPDTPMLSARSGRSAARFGAGAKDEPFLLRCMGRACEGLVVTVQIASPRPVDADLVALRSGLPPAAAPLLRARPADATPHYAPDTRYVSVKLRL